MKAIYWDGDEVTLDSSYPPPVPDQDTAIVKVHLAGICSTDLEIFKGYMQFRGVPGHEFVGSVREGPNEWLGKRVVGEINFGCGNCEFCARDLSRHCSNRTVMGILNTDGAFAEYVAVPLENLHLVPDPSVMNRQFSPNLSPPHLRYFDKFKSAPRTRSWSSAMVSSAIFAPRSCGLRERR